MEYMQNIKMRWVRISGVVLTLLLLYAAGVGLRRHVLRAQAPGPEVVLPFTLESALQFRLVRRVYEGWGIPRHDPDIQVPDGVRTFALDTTGAEAVFGRLARLFPRGMRLEERVRWMHVLWFCLGIPLVAIWVRCAGGAWIPGLGAGLLYATAISSVLRSTGQEISHENVAFPFLIAHLLADARIARGALTRDWRDLAVAAGSGLALGLALFNWDMVQVYTAIWALWRALSWVRRPTGFRDRRMQCDAVVWGCLLCVGVVSPYFRSHGFLRSPTLLAGYGVMLGAAWFSATEAAMAPRAARCGARLCFLLPWLAILPFASAFAESYNHFTELLWAKIRFLNRKPADPGLLTFSQRMLWTPALHSATWGLTRTLFPAFLWLTCASWVVYFPLFYRAESASDHVRRVLALSIASFVAFVFFVRFQVFVALFGSACIGMAWACLWRAYRRGPVGKRIRILFAAAVVAAACLEGGMLLRTPEVWGRRGVWYAEQEELTGWLKQHADGQPVLANFGISAAILTYGGCPIILHPKFESPDIRDRVEQYGRLIFGSDEEPLRAWAEAHGARYLVYGLGKFSEVSPEYQMRYMVNAMDPPEDAPARGFEYSPQALSDFRMLWGNRKYRVFRVRRSDDEEEWWFRRGAAQDALREGQLDEAERHAVQATQLVPTDAESWQVIHRVMALRRAGFEGER